MQTNAQLLWVMHCLKDPCKTFINCCQVIETKSGTINCSAYIPHAFTYYTPDCWKATNVVGISST